MRGLRVTEHDSKDTELPDKRCDALDASAPELVRLRHRHCNQAHDAFSVGRPEQSLNNIAFMFANDGCDVFYAAAGISFATLFRVAAALFDGRRINSCLTPVRKFPRSARSGGEPSRMR